MKSTKKAKVNRLADDMPAHIKFDYSKAKPNRFANRKKEQMVVALDSDITRVFRTPEEVTNALRALIKAYPHAKSPRTSARRAA